MNDHDAVTSSSTVGADLAVALHEHLICFLDEVAKDKDGPAVQGLSSIISPLTESLRGLFQHDTLLVTWEDGGAVSAHAFAAGVPVSSRSDVEAAQELAKIRSQPASEQTSSGLCVTLYGEEPAVRALCITVKDEPTAPRFWLVCQTAEPSEDWEWFVVHWAELKSLYFTVTAILRAQAATSEHRAAVRSQVTTLLRGPSSDRMVDAVELLQQLLRSGPGDLDILQEVAVVFLQSTLGSGWRIRSRPDLLLASVRLCQSALEHGGERDLSALRCVVRCLRVLHSPEEPDAGYLESAPLDLLPLWTQLHERWRPLCDRPAAPPRGVEAAWHAAVERTLPRLQSYLAALNAQMQATDDEPLTAPAARSIPSVRNQLYLWFCMRILSEEGNLRLFPKERSQLRAELAYVLRESLRFACFGDRPDYFFHAPSFTAALQLLVARHAHDIVGLPSKCAVGNLLSKLAQESGVKRLFAAEHFQHVVEIYISGHYLLSLRLDAADTAEDRRYLHGWTLVQALVGADRRYPDEETVRACRQAFSLAALFHDVDHLFLTGEPALSQALPISEDQVGESLERLWDGRRLAAQEEAERWGAELLAAGYLRPEDTTLKDWLKGEKQGSPYHGLLSAWCLHRLCTVLEPQFHAALRMAVRAILLHNALAVSVDAKDDPVAALLLLCDEIFEWDPLAQTAASETGRSLLMIGTELSPHVLRDRSIRLRNLHVSQDNAETCMTLPKDGDTLWPILDLTLMQPERLDLPVFVLWLRKSRNLGRVKHAPCGFGPTVVVRSGVSSVLQRLKLTNAGLLEELVDRVAPEYQDALRDWVLEICARTGTGSPEETVALGPLRTSHIYEAEFRKLRPELEQKAKELLREKLADNPEPLSLHADESLPPPLPDPMTLRKLMDRKLPSDADFMAFCQDKFPEVYRRFSDSMERMAKYNLLLQLVDAGRVSEMLDVWHSAMEAQCAT